VIQSAFGSVFDVASFGLPLYDAVSVQANSNYWTRPGGEQGWVQFAVQNHGTEEGVEPKVAICIWDFFDSRYGMGAPPLQYDTLCVGNISGESGNNPPTDDLTVYRRPGTYRQFDFAAVGGSVFQAGSERRIGMVAQISWFDSSKDPENERGLYAVVKPDTWGFYQNWTAIGGGMFGEGDGSEARFEDTTVVNRILAGSCANASGPAPAVPWPGSCPTQPPLLPNTRINHEIANTGEKHNLLFVGGEDALTLSAATPDLVYTQFLMSSEPDPSNPGEGICLDASSRIYVKDNPSDTGVVPSNINGQPFWHSPDLFLVPRGAEVNVNAAAPPVVVVPGQQYDAYMRVNNDYSCEDVTGVKVKMHIADPAALAQPWGAPITPGTGYAAPSGSSAGITVAAGGRALVGPFPYTAPTSGGAGHKCLIGSLISSNQSAPTDPLDAPNSYQVAQRNLAVGECTYPLTNATLGDGWVVLTLSADGALPSLTGDNDISMSFFDPIQDWYNVWVVDAGSTYSVSHDPVTQLTTVRLGPPSGTIWTGQTSLTLAPVKIGAGVTIAATGEIGLAPGEPDTRLSVDASQYGLYGMFVLNNGGSCEGLAPAPLNCGDGTLDSDEECDDDNTAAGDGCDERCKIEPFCGDGNVDPDEDCDDANTIDTDGCLHTCQISTGEGAFLEQNGLVVMEAESYTALKAGSTTGDTWGQISVGSASGGICMQVGPDSTNQAHTTQPDINNNAARLDLDVVFENAGTWYVWVRGASTTNQGYASDSCYLGVDGAANSTFLDYPDNGTYAWLNGTVSISSAGQHTINVFMREDGFIADKIILSNSQGFTPSGITQAESPRL